ncbi:MAG: hypothetical protein ABSH08_04445 [Tepidisphaeraceae bacterium]
MGRSAYDISIRETLQHHRGIGVAVAACLLCAAIAIAGYNFWPFGHKPNYSEAFYSDDDGQTYFKDSIFKLAPFDHNGKIANIAVVCTDGKSNFVAYLERFTPEAREQLQAAYDANPTEHHNVLDLMAFPPIARGGMELKLPGKDNPWILRSKMPDPIIQSPSRGDVELVRP